MMNVVNRSGKIWTEETPYGVLMNSLARKTFPLENSKQHRQQGIMNRSTSVEPKLGTGSFRPENQKTLPPPFPLSLKSQENPYPILFSELEQA